LIWPAVRKCRRAQLTCKVEGEGGWSTAVCRREGSIRTALSFFSAFGLVWKWERKTAKRRKWGEVGLNQDSKKYASESKSRKTRGAGKGTWDLTYDIDFYI